MAVSLPVLTFIVLRVLLIKFSWYLSSVFLCCYLVCFEITDIVLTTQVFSQLFLKIFPGGNCRLILNSYSPHHKQFKTLAWYIHSESWWNAVCSNSLSHAVEGNKSSFQLSIKFFLILNIHHAQTIIPSHWCFSSCCRWSLSRSQEKWTLRHPHSSRPEAQRRPSHSSSMWLWKEVTWLLCHLRRVGWGQEVEPHLPRWQFSPIYLMILEN